MVQHLHSVFVSTYAILFLGTPHNGSNSANLASTGRKILGIMAPSKVWDTDGQLLDALKEGSEVLQNINDMFVPLMKNFRVYYFWEQEKTNLGATLGYVCISFCFVRANFDAHLGSGGGGKLCGAHSGRYGTGWPPVRP
jgi:hypothetical protein